MFRKEDYPKKWKEITNRIKEAASWKCENCYHPHSLEGGYVLTTHHIDGNRMNLDENLMVALCQRCHLAWERIWIIGQLWLFEPPEWIRKRRLHL